MPSGNLSLIQLQYNQVVQENLVIIIKHCNNNFEGSRGEAMDKVSSKVRLVCATPQLSPQADLAQFLKPLILHTKTHEPII